MANRVIYTRLYDAEVEYLESTGTQYIDTAVYGSNNSKVELDLQLLELGASKAVFGCYSATDIGLYLYQAGGNDIGKWQFGFSWNANAGTTDTNRHFFVFDNFKIKIDGTIIISATPRNFTTTHTLLMFNMHNKSGGIYSATGIRIFSCKLYNGNTLVRDFIPVRRGNVGYMYDKVSGKLFGNKGTGNFILGPDVANPVPNIRRVFRFDNKRFVMPMPYDKRIEYLESTGTQWIDTDTKVNSLDSISVTLQFTQPNTPACIWNARNVNPIKNTISLFRMENNSLRFDYGKTQVSKNESGVNFSIKHEYKSVANTLYVDGISKASNPASSFTAGKSVKVLASSNSNNASIITNFAHAKLYSIKIINSNNEILRDLIPVRKNGIGYMYDHVSGKLFGNAGTGQFILGNDIND